MSQRVRVIGKVMKSHEILEAAVGDGVVCRALTVLVSNGLSTKTEEEESMCPDLIVAKKLCLSRGGRHESSCCAGR